MAEVIRRGESSVPGGDRQDTPPTVDVAKETVDVDLEKVDTNGLPGAVIETEPDYAPLGKPKDPEPGDPGYFSGEYAIAHVTTNPEDGEPAPEGESR